MPFFKPFQFCQRLGFEPKVLVTDMLADQSKAFIDVDFGLVFRKTLIQKNGSMG